MFDFIVFFVQLRLCNQRLLRSLRLRSVHNGGHRQLQNAKLVVCRFSLRNGLTPPVQSKIASFALLTTADGVRFRKRPPAHRRRAFAHTPYGTRMFAKVRRTNLLLILVLMHPTLSLDILRSRCHQCLVQRSHLLLLLRLLLSLRIHCSRGHGFLHRFLLCFLMYKDT